ncbi:MAG: NADH:ubiquinone reductase (Na(+)-transporting) subunit B [Ichthyobacteriaceae bacterium]|nr:NADH:ubiquinone reductase (Na(+)-transporting) subunit B [Ichthyobacteriaceae bacterium]
MKFLRDAFDGYKPDFMPGGKLEKWYPVFETIETFFFTPDHVTTSGSHIRDGVDIKRLMTVVVLALMPALFFGMYNIGYFHFEELVALGQQDSYTFMEAFLFGLGKLLPIIIVSYGVGIGVEFIFAMFYGHGIHEGYFVTGMLIPLIVPVDLPLWMLAVAIVFGVVIGKEIFGGTGMNILNPALLVRAFLFFAYPTFMSGDKVWVADALKTGTEGLPDGMSGATILGQLGTGAEAAFPTINGAAYSVMDMFIGFIPGSVGETSTLAILIGAVMLLLSGVASWRIMLSGVIGAAIMSFLFKIWGANELMLFGCKHLLIGGFAFGLVFMATDPVSAAQTNTGKWIYGFLIGFLSILLRVLNGFPEAVMLVILLLNVFAPTIDHYVVQASVKRRNKRIEDKIKKALSV